MDRNIKGIVILGSTGSIGTQALDVIRSNQKHLKVIGLAANRNHKVLKSQIAEFSPQHVSFGGNPDQELALQCKEITISDLIDIVAIKEANIVVSATTGSVALLPTFSAISAGKHVAIANKETIIMAGKSLISHAKTHGVNILPVDSEPSAIWQCLQGENQAVEKLIITGSGGALRDLSRNKLSEVTPLQALNHPTWQMGSKITVDSATMINKAFEVIEAHLLFDIPWKDIDVVIHPESIIHSMVQFTDGSTKAQMSIPDMRVPIQYALLHPVRYPNPSVPRFKPVHTKKLTFRDLDTERYPCFELALSYGKRGETWPSVLCGADEGAVARFLRNDISFPEIPIVIQSVLDQHVPTNNPSPKEVLKTSAWAERKALCL